MTRQVKKYRTGSLTLALAAKRGKDAPRAVTLTSGLAPAGHPRRPTPKTQRGASLGAPAPIGRQRKTLSGATLLTSIRASRGRLALWRLRAMPPALK